MLDEGQRKEKAEEPKYSDRSAEVRKTQQSKKNKNKTKNYYYDKEQQNIKSKNCMKYDK